MALPTTLTYGVVKWHAVSAVADTSLDPDALPNAVPVSGKVTFTPSATVLLSMGDEAVTVMATAVTYNMGPDGILRDAQGNDGVTLLATDSPNVTPINWTWNVSYQLDSGAARGAFDFSLVTAAVIDLTRIAPVAASGGVPVIQGTPGVGVSSAIINEVGSLVLTMSDGSALDAGQAKGPSGAERPSTIPSTIPLAKRWISDKSAYNITPKALARLRAGSAKATVGNARLDIAVIGTSISAGSGARTNALAWPNQLQTLLKTRGFTDGGSGFINAQSNLGPGFTDAIVFLSDGWLPFEPINTCLVRGIQETPLIFTDLKTSTSVTLYYLDYYTFALKWSIDDVAQAPITLGNSGLLKSVTVSGLPSAIHKVSITPGPGVSDAARAYIMGVAFTRPTGVAVHNLAIGSLGIYSASSDPAYLPLQMAKALSPKLTFIEMGANEADVPSNYPVNLQKIITELNAVGSDVVILGEPPYGVDAISIPYVRAKNYELADSNDIALIDLSDRLISWSSAMSLGLTYDADGYMVHWNENGASAMARHIFEALF